MTIPDLYKIFQKHPIVDTDTRCINPDKSGLFFCLQGNNFNGNTFADEAIDKGAAYVIIDDVKYLKNEKYILVNDSLAFLQELAKFHRNQLNIPVIGITGTNGKTTTKELIYAVLNKQYKVVATSGNLNNHIGVPLSVLAIRKETEIAIIEMGANHPGEIAQLCEIACPGYGIITNIGIAHTEGFGNLDNIISTKKALYDYIRKINGLIFVNGNDSLVMKLSENMNRIIYGNIKGSVCYGKIINNNPFLNLQCSLTNNLTIYDLLLTTNIIGAYNFDNILAAICIGKYFKVKDDNIKQGLEEYTPDGFRSQFIDTGKNKILMDAYNANPASMELAINNFANLNLPTPSEQRTTNNEQLTTNKVAIIGDMFELGQYAKAEHEKIIRLLKKQKFDKIILIGLLFSLVNDGFESFPDTDTACQHLKTNPFLSKTILIKGSRGMKLEKILEAL